MSIILLLFLVCSWARVGVLVPFGVLHKICASTFSLSTFSLTSYNLSGIFYCVEVREDETKSDRGLNKVTRPRADNSSEVIESQLTERIRQIGKSVGGDVITYIGPLMGGVDSAVRHIVERMKGKTRRKRAKIVFILETSGGNVEVTERIAETLRKHYRCVEFLVPNMAMSAGTVLVMSGDAIYMDYFSVLGPIDPQVEKTKGNLVPALGYLAQYDRLVKKSREGQLTNVEATWFINRFDPADLYSYEQARELSVALLKKWLVKYKFRNWKRTQTKKTPVSRQMKEQRAEWIARKLQHIEHWRSHGRGIHMQVLSRVLKLKIEDFSKNADLNDKIKSYYQLLTDYMGRLGHNFVVNTEKDFFSLYIGQRRER